MIPIGFWVCVAIIALGSFALSWMGIQDFQRTESAAQKNSFAGLGEGLLRLHQERARAEEETKKQAAATATREGGQESSSAQTVDYARAFREQLAIRAGYPGQPAMSVEITGKPWPLRASTSDKMQPMWLKLSSQGPLQGALKGFLVLLPWPGAPNQDDLVVPVQVSGLKPEGDETTSSEPASTI